jgi:hypothetical protein
VAQPAAADGNRVNGNNPDKSLQLKMWRAMQIADAGGLARKRVLDVGANDGFFTRGGGDGRRAPGDRDRQGLVDLADEHRLLDARLAASTPRS